MAVQTLPGTPQNVQEIFVYEYLFYFSACQKNASTMNPLIRFLSDRQKVFSLFATGILYSLYLWPLLNAILCISLGAYWLLFCKKNFNPGKTYVRLVLIFVSLFLPYAMGIL